MDDRKHRGGEGHRPPPMERKRHGAGRAIGYYLVLIPLNIALAVFTLYMFARGLAFDWTILQGGDTKAIAEAVFQVFLLVLPVILTVVLNRILYRAFRGRGRFAPGTAVFAFLAVLVVQAATIYLIFSGGYVEGVNGFSIETLGERMLTPKGN